MNTVKGQKLDSSFFTLFKNAVRSELKGRMGVSDAFIDTIFTVDEHVLIAGFTANDLPDWKKAEATAKKIEGLFQ